MDFLKKYKGIILLILVFWIIYSYISIIKHLHYQTFTWDTGFFDQLLWKLSRFKEPVSSFSNLHVFGDHFQFILLVFVPLYWLPQSINFLFIANAFVAVLASLPVYLISFKVNKSKAFALAVSFSMLIFTSMQFAILDGFHQSVFSPLFYAFAIYGLVFGSNWIYWSSLLGLLITKEEMALLAVSIGIIAFFKGDKSKGLATIAISLATFFFTIYFFLPMIQGEYVHSDSGALGQSPLEVLRTIVAEPILFFILLLISTIKIKTVIETFFSFGFLPIFSPIYLIPAFQQFAVRFIDTITIHRWTNLNHYAFPLASIMAVAAIFSARTLERILKLRGKLYLFLTLYLIFFALAQDYLLHGPVNSLLKADFYVKKQWMRDNDEVLKFIPKGASVAATNNFGPHISQRDKFYLIMEENFADYLLLDLEDGPNKYSPLDYPKTLEVFKQEILSGEYETIMQVNNAFLLKRIDG